MTTAQQKTLPQVVPANVNLKTRKDRAVYEQIKEYLGKEHWGKYVAIEPDSGDYEVARRCIEAILIP